MPLYIYHCRSCQHEFEEFSSIADRHKVPCKNCQGDNVGIVPGAGKDKTILFPEGYWEHVSLEGEHITSRRQLKEVCEKNNCYAKYLDGYLGV